MYSHIYLYFLYLLCSCDTSLLNSSGHTALDIAKFWNHREITELLSPKAGPLIDVPGFSRPAEVRNYFSHANTLDRCGNKRKDATWVNEKKQAGNTKFVLMHKLQPVVKAQPLNDHDVKRRQAVYDLFTTNYTSIADHLDKGSIQCAYTYTVELCCSMIG